MHSLREYKILSFYLRKDHPPFKKTVVRLRNIIIGILLIKKKYYWRWQINAMDISL